MNTHELIEKYVPLAKKLAFEKKKTLPNFVDVEDLQSAAFLGLTEAANRYDESRGIAFSTYAYPRIVGAILDFLRQQKNMLSIEAAEDDDFPLKDILVSKSVENVHEMFDYVVSDLDQQAEQIMKSYFVEECSMKQIGEKLGLSESRISQLLSECKSKIKNQWTYEELIELAA